MSLISKTQAGLTSSTAS